jgi:flavodoxin I
MKALVIYDTQFGNTERLARLISDAWLKHMTVRILPARDAVDYDFTEADVLIFGCPTQKHDFTPGFEAILETLPPDALKDKSVFVFDTRFRGWKLITGSAADSLAKRLLSAGARLVMSPESFYVIGMQGPLEQGEAVRAINWARAMLTELGVTAG